MENQNHRVSITEALSQLAQHVELYTGLKMRSLYATDASVYRALPLAVAYPKSEDELLHIVLFARQHQQSIIPRTAGTSLAGQCVGDGIVVDFSRYFTNILEINTEQRQVRVQPGVIRDELNRFLEPSGLFFSPNTSTSNRCMIGGMVANNSSGSTSIRYGVTRDKVLSAKLMLDDGSVVEVGKKANVTGERWRVIEAALLGVLGDRGKQQLIKESYPSQKVTRRNTGYALDEVIKERYFESENGALNWCKLLCGSEGTLALVLEVTLLLDPLPPKERLLLVPHFDSINHCLQSVSKVMQHELYACEMMDKTILDCTLDNEVQRQNRFFIQDDPQAILMLEIRSRDLTTLDQQKEKLLATLNDCEGITDVTSVHADQIERAFDLRKAGLGVLANLPGDAKSVACIEDTAVAVEVLADYINDFTALMESYDQKAIYYAHAGAGELHLRPMLNLKKSEDVALFKAISHDVAMLVKKYNGSLSGEHGDGRVRAPFIPDVLGDEVYDLLVQVKDIFDPQRIFNPGKIVEAQPIDHQLRYQPDRVEPEIETQLRFHETNGILRLAEKCNGSGDCRKLPAAGGGMCPSYHVTRNEQDTTRARANMLREVLTNSDKSNAFDSHELKEVYDLCVGCKACKAECPSNVDVALLKTEFLHQFHQGNPPTLRDKLFANGYRINNLGARFKGLANYFLSASWSSNMLKKRLGIAEKRQLPLLHNIIWINDLKYLTQPEVEIKKVALFVDEFSHHYDANVVVSALQLLTKLGYGIEVISGCDSGRAFISKGFLEKAKKAATKNINKCAHLTDAGIPLLGIEPSAILSFRDEYPQLVDNMVLANQLAGQTFLIEEFLAQEIELDNIKAEQFDTESREVLVHVHCHQKALSSTEHTRKILSLPQNHHVEIIQTGCCGMAGSFGYEAEHYEVSMQMGEISLFPKVRTAKASTIVIANGTSCRHQIHDGTKRQAIHPIELMWKALLR